MNFTSFSQDLSVVFMKIALGGSFLTWDVWGYVWMTVFAWAFVKFILKHKQNYQNGLPDLFKMIIYAGLAQMILGGPMYKEFGTDLFTASTSIAPATQCIAPVFSGGEISYEASNIMSPRKKSDYFHSGGKSLAIDAIQWLSWTGDNLSDSLFCKGAGGRMADNIYILGASFSDGFMGATMCFQFSGAGDDINPPTVPGTTSTNPTEVDTTKPTPYLQQCLDIVADKTKSYGAKWQDIMKLGAEERGENGFGMGDMFIAAFKHVTGPLVYIFALLGGLWYLGPMMGGLLFLGAVCLGIVYVLSLIFNFIMAAVFSATMALSLIGFIMVSPFMILEDYRDRVTNAMKVPLSTCLYGFAANLISWVANLFVLGALYQINVVGNSGGSVIFNFTNMIMISLVALFVMILVLALQSWAITKVPKLALGLIRLDLDSVTTIGQEVMDTVKMVGSGVMMVGGGVVGGALAGSIGAKMASGMGRATSTAMSGVGKIIGKMPFGDRVVSSFANSGFADRSRQLRNFLGGQKFGLPQNAPPIGGTQNNGFAQGSTSSNTGFKPSGGNGGFGTSDVGGGGSAPPSPGPNSGPAPASSSTSASNSPAAEILNNAAQLARTRGFGSQASSLKQNEEPEGTARFGNQRINSFVGSSEPTGQTKRKNASSGLASSTNPSRPSVRSRISPNSSGANDGAENIYDKIDPNATANEPGNYDESENEDSEKHSALANGEELKTRDSFYDHQDIVEFFKDRKKQKTEHRKQMFGMFAGFIGNSFDAGVAAAGGSNFNMNNLDAATKARQAQAQHREQMVKQKENMFAQKDRLVKEANDSIIQRREEAKKQAARAANADKYKQRAEEEKLRQEEARIAAEEERLAEVRANAKIMAEEYARAMQAQQKPSRKKNRKGRRSK